MKYDHFESQRAVDEQSNRKTTLTAHSYLQITHCSETVLPGARRRALSPAMRAGQTSVKYWHVLAIHSSASVTLCCACPLNGHVWHSGVVCCQVRDLSSGEDSTPLKVSSKA
jgi:hypothetical protein